MLGGAPFQIVRPSEAAKFGGFGHARVGLKTLPKDNGVSWSDFYKGRLGQSYVSHVYKNYKAHIEAIRRYIIQLSLSKDKSKTIKPLRVVEAGCGIGSITLNLADMSDHKTVICSGFDVSEGQVVNSRENALLNNVGDRVSFHKGDIFNRDMYKDAHIIHSHGVLEHFNDDDIMEILLTQLSAPNVRYVIHYVPLEGWKTPSYGDERLLPLTHWVNEFAPTRTVAFNDGKDAVLIWDVESLLRN